MEIVRLEGASISAEMLPAAGARLHRLRAFGHELLRAPEDTSTHLSDPFFWGAYVLAPWANRVTAGPTRVAGRQVDLPANFPDGSAIHGQVYDRRWERSGDGFAIAGGGDGWPWAYEVSVRPAVSGDSLRLEYALRNRSEGPMPAGLGLHPWWRKPVEVAIPAPWVYPTASDSPAQPEAVSGRWDRRVLEPLPDGLDAAWTHLVEPVVELRWPETGVRLAMRASGPQIHVVAASPAERDAVAVEVQTHAPQGVRRLENGEPGALALIGPGTGLSLTIELTATLDA